MNPNNTKPIIAFDILPMSSTQRQEGVRVAAFAKFADGETKEWSQLTRNKFVQLINKHDFQFIGTDNPSEILESGESLGVFCQNLPPQTSLVHVNLTRSGNTVSLQSLVMQHDILGSPRKLSPIDTSKAMVKLIEKGVGMILEPFENETLIKVGRPSGSSKGGWSQSRYQRQAEEVVAREAKKIKSLLQKNDLSYDEVIHSTKYGAKMARFHIFSPKSKIDDALDDVSFYPANVKIWSPKKQVVTHRPLDISRRPHRAKFYNNLRRLIVGIDPGMTVGVAIGSLHGEILTVFSRKNLSKGQLVSELTNYGVPVLICADVDPVPAFVNKFAATYNAEIFSPGVELSKADKRHLANKAELKRRLDSHERDALAAVIRAQQKYNEHFTKIDEEDSLTRKEKNLAKGMVLRGLSIADAIKSVNLLREEDDKTHSEKIEKKDKPDIELLSRISNLLEDMAVSEEIISNLRAHTGRLEAKNTLLKTQINQLKAKIADIQESQMRKVLSSELIEEKERRNKVLKRKLEIEEEKNEEKNKLINELEEMLWLSLEKDGQPVKVLPKFSHDAIEELRSQFGLTDGDIVYITDPTGGGPQTASNLVKNDLKFVFIASDNLPEPAAEILYKNDIPVLVADKYSIRTTTHLGLINSHNLLQAQEDYQKKIEKRKADEKAMKIMKTIENYQYERNKELKGSKPDYDDYEPDEELLEE